MKSLKASVLAVLVIAATNFSMAQEKKSKTVEERAQFQTERMVKELGLSEEQEARITEINYMIASKNDVVRKDVNFTPAQKQLGLEYNFNGRKHLLQNILTPEQITLYDQKEAARKAASQETAEDL
jgi:Spy/CpxP family protein refolding chaperone